MNPKALAENIADMLWSASDKQASLSAVESLLAEAMREEHEEGHRQGTKFLENVHESHRKERNEAYERAAQGRCCDNGNFDEIHRCQKQPSPAEPEKADDEVFKKLMRELENYHTGHMESSYHYTLKEALMHLSRKGRTGEDK